MEPSARLFNCARCHKQVIICSDCDRGNIYCSDNCSKTARRESLRAAGLRYQQTRRGRFNNASRQQRYRIKVTHQGSQENTPHDLLPANTSEPEKLVMVTTTSGVICHFCHKLCQVFLRRDFLQS